MGIDVIRAGRIHMKTALSLPYQSVFVVDLLRRMRTNLTDVP